MTRAGQISLLGNKCLKFLIIQITELITLQIYLWRHIKPSFIHRYLQYLCDPEEWMHFQKVLHVNSWCPYGKLQGIPQMRLAQSSWRLSPMSSLPFSPFLPHYHYCFPSLMTREGAEEALVGGHPLGFCIPSSLPLFLQEGANIRRDERVSLSY